MNPGPINRESSTVSSELHMDERYCLCGQLGTLHQMPCLCVPKNHEGFFNFDQNFLGLKKIRLPNSERNKIEILQQIFH